MLTPPSFSQQAKVCQDLQNHNNVFCFICFVFLKMLKICGLIWLLLTCFVFALCLEFPANEIVKFIVGFTNKGSQDFTVQSLEASFRYPQDFQFFIQNVSEITNMALGLI